MTSFGDYQDTLINHQTTQISHHTTNHSKLEDIKTKLDAVVTNTANINVNVGDVEINVQDVENLITSSNTKLDTINTTLSSGIGGLPVSLTGSGNLKVSLQELGNEGSERLNVDVGSTVSQLPSALTGEGNLKVSIQEDFTHNLSTSAKQDTQITHLSNIDTGIDNLEACVGSNKVNVNISSGNISGFSTSAKQDTQITHLSNIDTGIDVLEACCGSDKVNVNISSGNITGFSTATLQGTTNGKLDTINSSLGDIATESTLQTIAEFNCDTTDVTITGGVVLPSALTGSGNLKVCIQELGNEGSERLNVDIGNAVAQLPSALSGSGRLKIENDFDGAITHGALTELASAINSDKVDVNISSGNISGFSTASLQGGGLPSALSSDNLKVSLKESITVPVSNAVLTSLNSAINSDKVDVNISSGNISGFATSAKQDTIETSLNAIETEVKLGQTCEDKEVIDDDAISPETLSIVIDTESYKNIRFYGNTTTSPAVLGGSNLLVYGSNASSGTYYNIPATSFSVQTLTISGGSAIHHIGLTLDNVPRYIKIFNKSNSATYTISKLRMVGSNKMINV